MASNYEEHSKFSKESEVEPVQDEYADEVAEIRSRLEATGSIWNENFIRKQLDDWKRHDLNIGVIGCTKPGKSSFINAIRGLKDTDDGAAAVDVVECTHTAAPYKHPDNHKLILWDLPGVGTLKHTKEDFQQFNIGTFDFVLILSEGGFTEIETILSEKIRKANKRFYFVRTKVDIAIRKSERDYQHEHNPSNVLREIKRECEKQIKTTDVFLISNKHPHLYDFCSLVIKLTEGFPSMKRDALILSLSAFDSQELLDRKREICRNRAYYAARLSAAVAVLPVPGLGAVDIAIIADEMAFYREQFGVDDKALQERAAKLNITVDVLKSRYDERSAITITAKTLLSIATVAMVSSEVVEDVLKFAIPVLGSVLAAGASYGTTLSILWKLIEVTYEDACKLGNAMARKSGFEIEYQVHIDRSFIRSVAVLGKMGTGKSSLVNALRGVKAADPGAAKVGVTETTIERKCYTFPTKERELYELWDLPGTQTATFPRNTYLNSIKYDAYDIFIICSSSSFTEMDMWLAKEISKLGRPMLFVRTKVQDDIDNVSRGESSLVLSRIRENYTTPLEKNGLGNTRVFIVDTAHPSKFEFPQLRQYLRRCVENCEKRKTSCIVS